MYLEDFRLQEEIEIAPVVIDKERMLAFAELYDPIAIHLDEEYAKSTRFGALIAPGVMTFMSVWAKFMQQNVFGKELIAGKSTRIEWFKPVYAGDTLRGTARISNLTRRNAYNGIAEITVDVYNQNGDLILTNVTESVVKCRTEGVFSSEEV